MPNYEIYTTGGGPQLTSILNFLAMFTSGSMWFDFLTIGILLGVFFTVIKIALTGSFQGVSLYIVMVAVMGAASIGPKVRVIVMDTTYPLEIYGAVDNVPYPVAAIGSLTSRVSYHLTRRMEAMLAPPDNLTYQRHGILFGATLMSQAARWRAVTPSVHNNLVNFMENCMVDGANLGLVDIDEMGHTGDLASLIANDVPSALAYYDETSDGVMRCDQGWAGFATYLNDEVNTMLMTRAQASAPRGGNAAGYADVAALTGTLEDFQTYMGLSGYDSVRYLRQSMLVQALDSAVTRQIASSGNAAAMANYQAARAELQTRSSYDSIMANATKWVPVMKIAFEALYYGAFPIAIMLMMTPLAGTVFKGYFGGFVWLAAWEPLNAIIHSVVLDGAVGHYREHTTTIVGGVTQDVLSWANHLGVRSVSQDVASSAGFLMMTIPFISFALFFGASRVAGMATSMLNVSQGAAIDTGREAATGSMSLGNTSMNNVNANAWDTSHLYDAGRATRYLDDGSTVTSNRDGSSTFGAGSAQSNVGLSATVGQSVREEVSDRYSESQREMQTASRDYTQSLTATASQLSDFGRSVSDSRTAGAESNWNATESQGQQAREAWSQVEEFAENHNLSTDLALRAMLGGRAGTPPAMLSAELQASGTLSANDAENFQEAVRASQTGEYSQTISTLISSADRAYEGAASSETATASNSVRSNYDEMVQDAERFSEAQEQARVMERANAWMQSADMGYNQQITDAVIGELRERGFDDDTIAQLVNPKSAAGIARQQEVIGEFLPGIIEDLGILAPNPEQHFAPIVRPDDGPVTHQPVDPNEAAGQVQSPDYGRYDERAENAERLNDGNFSSTQSRMDEARGRQEEVEDRIATGSERTDVTVGEAVLDRGAGVFGADWLDEAGAVTGTPGQPAPAGGGGGDALPSYQRDAVTRILLGEAGGRSPTEQAQLAHVIRNRMEAGGFGDDPAEVAFGLSPDVHVSGMDKNSQDYRQAATIVDQVFSDGAGDPLLGRTELPDWFGQSEVSGVGPLDAQSRDVVIRTILGEAAGEGADGQAAVAHVIRNRVADDRFADTAIGVAQAPQQFSAWNSGAGGNDLVNRYGPGDAAYDRVGQIVDAVWSGDIRDMTGGATHYYSPAGMRQLVSDGHQSNLEPRWLDDQNAQRGYAPTQIGGHIFTGRVRNG